MKTTLKDYYINDPVGFIYFEFNYLDRYIAGNLISNFKKEHSGKKISSESIFVRRIGFEIDREDNLITITVNYVSDGIFTREKEYAYAKTDLKIMIKNLKSLFSVLDKNRY